MKKIINGKKYDTDTATKLGSFDNGYFGSDLDYLEETLYRKKTGEFFLYGEGGARTKYSVRCSSNSYCGGCDITPLSNSKAKAWAEENLTSDEYEAIFGLVEE